MHSVPVHHRGFNSGGLGPIAELSPQAGQSVMTIAQWIWTQTRLQGAIWKMEKRRDAWILTRCYPCLGPMVHVPVPVPWDGPGTARIHVIINVT